MAFFATTLALLYWTRPFAVKFLNRKRARTNVEETIGQSVKVIERVDNAAQTGKVNYKGMEWTARANSNGDVYEAGETAYVDEVRGVTMLISRESS